MTTIQTSADAYAKAASCFREAILSAEPIRPYADGMRAICKGMDFGRLSGADLGNLIPLVAVAKPRVLGAAVDRARVTNRHDDLQQAIGPVILTIALVLAWGTSLETQDAYGLTMLADRQEQFMRAADMIESLVQLKRADVAGSSRLGTHH